MMPPILAHGLASGLWEHWTFEPVTVALLVGSCAWYAAGVSRLWSRAGRGRGLRQWEALAFVAGLFVVAVALLSPLAWISEVLFSAHMTQHEALMLIAAPLLAFGRPLHVFLWAFQPPAREAIGRWTRGRTMSVAWHALTGPAAAFALHAIALWIWHLPLFYEAALASTGIHALQHACFLITAALFWWGMLHGRYGRIGYGVSVLYVFLTAVHSGVLGALMTVAPHVWYPSYTEAGARWHVDPLADQQIAGLLMWVPSGVFFIVFGLALLAAWLGESERRARLGSVTGGSGG